jgi:predicted ATPase/DNA-binding SARP family transcriptional activator
MSQLALYLLGPPRIELNGEPVHIGRARAVALLAYLAVEGGLHRRDSLAALIWPEYDRSSARADLRRTLSLLNRKLGKGWLVADRETAGLRQAPSSTPLALRDASQLDFAQHPRRSERTGLSQPERGHRQIRVDVHVFRRRLAECEAHGHGPGAGEVYADCVASLEEAVALYRDHFLAGFTLAGSLAFDEWQFFQTERLKDQLASALERLIRWQRDEGEMDAAIAYARRWLALDATHEPAQQRLMRLYALSGQQSAALRQYQLCQATLAEELGVPPSPQTVALYKRIRAGEEIGPEQELEPAVPHNLPPPPTPLVGREAELAQLGALIADPGTRLVTITGPGGVGKTRLALALAERQVVPPPQIPPSGGEESGGTAQEPSFRDGVYFVPLAGLSAGESVFPATAKALGFSFHGQREPQAQLLDYLREKRLLLLLDNVEHLLAGPQALQTAAPPEGIDGLIAEMLRAAPSVQILATSRQRLGLHQEQVFAIQGLPYPDRETPDATAYPAVRLFLNSAWRAQPQFELAEGDLAALTRLCRLLDGMPLGLELASAWVNVLSLTDIASETQASLDFLETDWPDVPSRHRSMRAVFRGSWRRLSAEEQDVLAQLSIFRGGFTRDAAQKVTGASLRTLAGLADKSLLAYDRAAGRYEMHELLRQYGADKLKMLRDREKAARDRHSEYFCAALGRWRDDLTGPRELEALGEIETDLENVRAAWEWAAVQGHAERLYPAIDALGQFFFERARAAEGDRLFQSAYDGLARVSQPLEVEAKRTLARALLWRSRFNNISLLHIQAKDLLRQSQSQLDNLALAGQDVRSERAFLHDMLGLVVQPDWEASARHYEQALALYKQLGQRYWAAWTLCRLGESNCRSGKPETGMRNYEEALALFRAVAHQSGLSWALVCLGNVARGAGDYDRAQRLYSESLALARAQGNRQRSCDCLRAIGLLALFLGHFHAGAGYLEESIAISREVGDWIRLTYTSGDLATAYWFSGAFDRAYAVLDRILTIVGEQEIGFSHGVIAYQSWLDVYVGRYDTARMRALESLELNPHEEPYGMACVVPRWVLGWAALADGAYAQASQPLRQAIAALRKGMVDEVQEFIAWSMAPLGRAALGLGDREAARRHLSEGLQIAVQIRGFIPLLHLMPVITLLLAEQDAVTAKERAVELHALSLSHPFLAKAQLFEDIAWRQVRAATASLPPDVVAAAQARGHALDWWETAEELLDELDG